MIIWLNGTFGVGKTTTAARVRERLDGSRIFDPEHVGYMLAGNLRDLRFDDFQDLPPWRALVPRVLLEVQRFTGATVIAPQSVLVEDYWDELSDGMAGLGLEVLHVVLDGDEDLLRARIDADEAARDARQWRLDHLAPYAEARRWMCAAADLVIDTADAGPEDVATAIVDASRA